MGAGQSTSTSSSSPEFTSGKSKTSYYTLLGVPRSATEEEIKKAYRRKALELHPDRNYGNVESATQLFAEVQSAYEILSDPQERAWYDSHEAAILRGDDDISGDAAGSAGSEVYAGEMKVTTADDLARLLRKFNSGVEFSDAPSGFFGFLRETFERLAKEEQVAVRWEGGDEVDYPGFGHKEDSYDNVVKPFYAVWSSFATRKSFKWLDKYRLSDAPDRRYRRAMEKENEKAREDGRREFNDAVRSLVAFVRKRDPRYVPTQQSEEERQRVLRDAADAQKARARKEKEELLKQAVPEWAQVVQKDVLEGEIEESGSEDEQFECVACRKTFKSEKQWEAHEKSKKHQKAVQSLKKKMRKENQQLDIDDDELDEGMDALTGVPGVNQSDLESLGSVKDDDLTQHTDALKLDSDDLHEEESEKPKEEEEDLTPADLIPAEASDESSGDNSDYAPEAVIKDRIENELHGARRITSGGRDSHTFQSKEGIESGTEDGEGADVGITRQPKKGKAAQKRAKKAAAAATAEQTNNKFKCAMCQAAFPSKTRLFQHIKDFGHAALKPTAAGGVKKKGKR